MPWAGRLRSAHAGARAVSAEEIYELARRIADQLALASEHTGRAHQEVLLLAACTDVGMASAVDALSRVIAELALLHREFSRVTDHRS